MSSLVLRPRVETMIPRSTNRSATSTAETQLAAGVAADVDHQALHALAMELPQRGVEIAGRGLLEQVSLK